MSIEVGDILYRYTIRHGRFIRNEGTVAICNGRKTVLFRDGVTNVRCPRDMDIGVIRHVGPSLWMTEKNDELAKEIYLEFEERRLSELRRQLETKEAIVELLKGDCRVARL